MSIKFRNLIILALMLSASGLAYALRPTHRIADEGQKVNLEQMIPTQFGEWQLDTQQAAQIVNPEQKELIQRIYAQTLSRSYVNAQGERIMLTIAYGEDQSDAKQLHYPEICYPAQGFQLISTKFGEIKTAFGNIRVKRLMTTLGDRSEPLTYWTTVGNHVVMGGKETKLEQLKYGFKGQIPDGLLFRVSSLTPDETAGYALQQEFVRTLVPSLTPQNRLKLAGLPGTVIKP